MPTLHLMPRILKEYETILFLYKPPHWDCTIGNDGQSINDADLYGKLLIARYISLNLKNHLQPAIQNSEERYGMCNRLDDVTSGIIIVAKTADASKRARASINAHATVKIYMALVHGVIDTHHVTVRKDICCTLNGFMQVCQTGEGRTCRRAHTQFRVIRKFAEHTLVAVRIFTGVTHQIRVHMKSIGFPIVGDNKYSPPNVVWDGRLFLHSTYYALTPEVKCFCPLPPDLLNALNALEPHKAPKNYSDEPWLMNCFKPLILSTQSDGPGRPHTQSPPPPTVKKI